MTEKPAEKAARTEREMQLQAQIVNLQVLSAALMAALDEDAQLRAKKIFTSFQNAARKGSLEENSLLGEIAWEEVADEGLRLATLLEAVIKTDPDKDITWLRKSKS
ncbi:hypothetical protein [Acetobacter pasteurianus]|uniref:hypothetical protein n=1 Tax=Acetobacter pasteurianus TaxID=438 RepID=UPI003D0B755B